MGHDNPAIMGLQLVSCDNNGFRPPLIPRLLLGMIAQEMVSRLAPKH